MITYHINMFREGYRFAALKYNQRQTIMRIREDEIHVSETTTVEKDLWNVIRYMQDAFAILNPVRDSKGRISDFVYSFINETGCKELKLPCREITGKKISDIFPGLIKSQLFKAYCRVAESGRPKTINPGYYEEIVRGRKIRGAFDLRITKYGDGIALTWRNLSERRKLEKALRQSEENFRLALSRSKITVFHVSTTLKLTWIFNPHPEFDTSSIENGNLLSIIDAKSEKAIRNKFQAVLNTQKGIVFEQKVIIRDHPFEYEIKVDPYFNGKGRLKGLYCIAIDISGRKQVEKKLKQALMKLESSNRELEQFAYIASHDLQEPLRMVSNYSQLLSKRYCEQLDDRARDYIGFITGGAQRMQSLIIGLLEYSRITTRAKPFENVDLNQVIEDVLSDMHILIQKTRSRITVEKLPAVHADPVHMHRLFMNLIGNSIKFCDKDHPEIKIEALKKRELHIVCVKDNGIGIEKEHYSRVFQIFQRLHSQDEYPGTGMGLAICRKIVEWHKGRVLLRSKPGEGTNIYIILRK